MTFQKKKLEFYNKELINEEFLKGQKLRKENNINFVLIIEF